MAVNNRDRVPISRYMRRIMVCIVVMFVFTVGCVGMSVLDNNKNYLHNLQQNIRQKFAEVDEELATMNRYAISILYYNENMNLLKKADNVIDRNYHASALLDDIEATTQFLKIKYTFCVALPGQDIVLTSTGGDIGYAEKRDAVAYILDHFISALSNEKATEAWDTFQLNGKSYSVNVYGDGENYVAMFCKSDSLFSFFDVAFPGGQGTWTQLIQEREQAQPSSQLNTIRATISETISIKRLAVPVSYRYSRKMTFENSVTTMAPLLIIAILNIVLLLHIESSLRWNIIEPLKRFARNLQDESAVQDFSQGNSPDEITGIARFVADLYDNIRSMKISVYEERLLRQKAEMDFLRLQIKPHFYINCLGIIFSLAESGQYALIQRLAMNLSNYMRYLFTDAHNMVPVESEIRHISEYLDIQNVRLKTRHKVRCNSEDPLGCMVPVLSLLTLAENSSKNNRGLEGELLITLHVEELEERIRITISDNGVGYPPALLQRLNSDEEGDGSSLVTGIGIANVKKRLKILYGDNFWISFQNGCNGGAETIMEIPKNTEAHWPGEG